MIGHIHRNVTKKTYLFTVVKTIKIKWFRLTKGNWNIRWGKLIFKFYSFGNGYIRIGRRKIKLIPSRNKKLPASAGWVYFRFGKHTYYLRFYGRNFHVLIFGKCKHYYRGARGFCGIPRIYKGKSTLFTKYVNKPKIET